VRTCVRVVGIPALAAVLAFVLAVTPATVAEPPAEAQVTARSPEPGPPRVPGASPAGSAIAPLHLQTSAMEATVRSRDEDPRTANWSREAFGSLARAEYRFSRSEDGSWSAPNRGHDLRAKLAPGGVELTSRIMGADESAGGWVLRMSLTGLGRGAILEVVPAGTIEDTAGDRVQSRRPAITEWYRNDEAGLEQGFTIAAPPGGTRAPGRAERDEGSGSRGASPEQASPLVVEMTIDGDLTGDVSADGRAILFKNPLGKPVLRYGELAVRDASGAPVRARLNLVPGRLRILVDDSDAVYPITVDPLLTSAAWTAESNQASAQLGAAVATAGDVNGDGFSDVIVGAPLYDNGQADEGRVFVYLGSASGLALAAAWIAESNQASAQLGASVASAGDINGDGYDDVLIGAPLYDNGQTDEGRVFVYLGSASGLGPNGDPTNADWSAESNQATAHLGAAVAAAGDVNGDGDADVILGAPLYDNGQTDEGRAFVYLGSASGLGPNGDPTNADWMAESNQASAQLGTSVAAAGDVNGDGYADVILGAPLYDNGQSDEGRAFVWLGAGSGLGANGDPTNADWSAESNQASSQLGAAVATAGDVNGDGYADVLIGAPFNDNGQTDEGRAFVWLGAGSGLGANGDPTNADWSAESDLGASEFGGALAPAGDVDGDGYADVVIGAPALDNGVRDEGRAYVFNGSASGLAAAPSWSVESDQRDAFYGFAVGAAGDVNGDGFGDVIVGSYLYDNGQGEEGRAFVYLGSPAGPATSPAWSADGNQQGANFGISLASAGDVNGDGFGDVIIGAAFFDNGQTNEGRVFVYLGSSVGLPAAPSWTAESDQAESRFGYSVAGAGDVNGDGYSDVIVGAYLFNNGQTDEGRAFVYLGSASGLGAIPAWTAEPNQTSAQFGSSVAGAGDVNGDGYADVLVGAFGFNNDQVDEGAAYLYLGSASGLGVNFAWRAEGNQTGDSFGTPVASAGDVNGDGFSDVLVGAWEYDNGQNNEGRAFLYLGSLSGLSLTPAWTAESDQADAIFGFPLTSAGDVNGDGYSDVLVGATGWEDGETDEGRAYLYLGSASGLAATPAWTIESNQVSASLGYVRAPAGDVNGDGYSDILIGDPYWDNAAGDAGRVDLYLGSPSGPAASPAWSFEGSAQGDFVGYASAGAGDVNGDGFADLLVGAYSLDDDQFDEGRAYLFYGNASAGVTRIPRQARADGAAPIDLLGSSESESSFRIRARGRTPEGRGLVRLLSEVKPLGAPFDGSGLHSSAPASTGAPSASGSYVDFNELIGGLDPETPYRWRVRFASVSSPVFARSPWLTLAGNALTEADLRTSGCTDADNDGYGQPGDASCPAGPQTDCNDANPAVHPGVTELCNNVDDNCDGTTDAFPTSCGVGGCARTGTCTAGVNNCAPGPPSAEQCDNIDNNCDGTVDGFATSCGVGACASTGTCTAGVNSCAPGPPSTEQCDNVDNNCDGTVDGFTTSCGVGACARTGTCTAGVNSCAPGPPSTEQCDNVDNNCDGTVDGFTTSCGVGACGRSGTCTAGVNNCTPGAPVGETCNLADDDCDGSTDEGVQTTFYGDLDADGFGRPTITTLACTTPSGYSENANDCDDNIPAVWATPGEAGLGLTATHNVLSGVTTLTWGPPAAPGGTAPSLRYDTLRTGVPSDFTAPAECLESSGTDTATPDAQSPAPGGVYFYLVRAVNACPSGTGTLGTKTGGAERPGRSCPVSCAFNGTVSIAPVSSPPNMDLAPKVITVSASGADTYTAANLRIVKSGGGTDFDQTLAANATSWPFNWTPGQGVGTYVATAKVSNGSGCTGSATRTWVIVVPACVSCMAVVPSDPTPTGGSPRWYRQQNSLNNTCIFPVDIGTVRIRARSICATCASPLKLLRLQYLPTGNFASETSDTVYTAPGPGDDVSIAQTATIDLSATPLSVPASSTGAKVRFIFSTSTPIWVGNPNAQKSVLEADFAFQQPSGYCSAGELTGQKLEVTP
jgi:hypothetical protein